MAALLGNLLGTVDGLLGTATGVLGGGASGSASASAGGTADLSDTLDLGAGRIHLGSELEFHERLIELASGQQLLGGLEDLVAIGRHLRRF